MKEVLFISHDASRTGAPILLLHLLRWLKTNTDIPFRILLKNHGELEPEFRKLAPTIVFDSKPKYSRYGKLAPCVSYAKRLIMKSRLLAGKINIGLIYSNTITNGNVLDALSFLSVPVISHAHELEYIIRLYGLEEFNRTKELTTHYIACSHAVKENLVRNHAIAMNRVSVIHECIPTTETQMSLNDNVLEVELKVTKEAFIVGASGTIEWRKGADLFVQLAHHVKRYIESDRIHFVWVGGHREGLEYFRILQDIQKCGLESHVHFVGSKRNPQDYYRRFNVFSLTSREDPFPLVCLENALLGKPILCFDQAGGEPEFVESDCGFVVPYLDLESMKDRILQLYCSHELARTMGDNAQRKVRARHGLDETAKRVADIINTYIH